MGGDGPASHFNRENNMQKEFEISAQPRDGSGKAFSRRMRGEGLVPAILYGGTQGPVSLVLKHNELVQHLEHEAFYSHILTLKVGGKKEKVILRDLQRHPAQPRILHIDFMRVSTDKRITMNVPLHFINEDTCIGVKQQGGIVSHLQTEAEVSCLPQDLPEYIGVDIVDLELGQSLHLSDVTLPENVVLLALSHGEEVDHAIVSVIKPRVAALEEEEEAAAETEEEAEAQAEEGQEENKEEPPGK